MKSSFAARLAWLAPHRAAVSLACLVVCGAPLAATPSFHAGPAGQAVSAVQAAWPGLATQALQTAQNTQTAQYTQTGQTPPTPATTPAPSTGVSNSALDALMFYQLLLGEIELRGGQGAVAFEVMLDAARRSRDEQLFKRAVDIALQTRAGDQALTAARAWRLALPDSAEAPRVQVQLLAAMGRTAEAAEPLRSLLARVPAAERAGLIASLPRVFARAQDAQANAALLETALKPYSAGYAVEPHAQAVRLASAVALGRVALAAGDTNRALALAQDAARTDPLAPGPALLALELMAKLPAAESLVTAHLAQAGSEPSLRLAYASSLARAQRYPDAVRELETATQRQPTLAAPWLTLGALQLELKQAAAAERALLRFVELRPGAPLASASAAPSVGAASADADDEDDEDPERSDGGLVQAWLLLSQAAEMRKDFAGAEKYLARIDNPQRALDVQTRRALILARQGRVAQARELLQKLPESTLVDARAKILAEAQVLREVKQWQAAYGVLAQGLERLPKDTDLLYEQSMVAEKLNRPDDMERLLRQVIALKPDHQHAYNALGYALADRGQRLPEARELIRKALELAPGDPFITDSLGWVEFRLGQREEALRLLRLAYASRPDTEIAAHLGEVLWVLGQRDEALRVWRQGRDADASNEVLVETLRRLKAPL